MLWLVDLGGVPLAVRSSASAEELPGASFAGQHGTYFIRTVAKLPDEVEVLKGISVSAGIVRGPARVFLTVDSHEDVLPGEILVAPFTDPGWTPYFIPAAGIVMDMGGMLSHGSIIAREYGIPPVANVGPATRIITTGQLIEVDGDHGVVRILQQD
jgi:phosphoenolpyruvate synthase/pyruvate phosphate dikinase